MPVTATAEYVEPKTAERFAPLDPALMSEYTRDENGDVLYEPKIDKGGNFYWRPLTEKELLDSLEAARKSPGYTTEEVVQKLEAEFGTRIPLPR